MEVLFSLFSSFLIGIFSLFPFLFSQPWEPGHLFVKPPSMTGPNTGWHELGPPRWKWTTSKKGNHPPSSASVVLKHNLYLYNYHNYRLFTSSFFHIGPHLLLELWISYRQSQGRHRISFGNWGTLYHGWRRARQGERREERSVVGGRGRRWRIKYAGWSLTQRRLPGQRGRDEEPPADQGNPVWWWRCVTLFECLGYSINMYSLL